MNVLFVCEYEWLKSVVFDIHVLAEGLSLMGHKVYVVDYEWEDKSGIRLKTVETVAARVYPAAKVILRRPGYIRIRVKRPVPMKMLPVEYMSTTITHYLEIRKILRENEIDIIVLYSVLTNGMSTVHLGRQFKIPVVHRNIDMLHKLSPNPLKRLSTRLFEKKVYPAMDSILALTPKYIEYLENLGADRSKTRLLLFPIDTALFRPGIDCDEIRRAWGINNDDQVIVFVGTLYKFGGLDQFIYEFPDVLQQFPRAKLLVVGDGLTRGRLERSIDELSLTGRVVITGFQPFEKMPQFINMASVCVNAFPVNRATEDLFSAKIIQYMACGKPTVCSALPGIMTLLPGESCGVVYAEGAADMASKVINLLESAEQRERLGQAGLSYVRREHSYEKITRQLESALQEIIARNRARTLKKRANIANSEVR